VANKKNSLIEIIILIQKRKDMIRMKAIKSNQGKCALREKKNIFYLSFSIV
jgi:hypothetical protein